jgi:hypothetical protein
MVTLKILLERHPEWADLPLVVYCPDGHYDWVGEAHHPEDGGAGVVYTSETCADIDENDKGIPGTETMVLVFSAN